MAEKLTEARVRNAPTQSKRYSIMDAKEPGLELRIHPDGRRVFALRQSIAGKDIRLTLGPYGPPPALSLDQARTKAAECRLRLKAEGDFRQADSARVAQQQANDVFTLNRLIDEWLKHARNRLRATTLALHEHRLDKHVRPNLGSQSIDGITRADVRELVVAIGEAGHAVTANKIAQLVSTLYRFARSELERDVLNPAADLKPYRETPRDRVLSDDEIRALWLALDDPEKPPGPQVAIALKVALYSGQRIGEIVGMRDSELDLRERLWLVPGDRTKSGRQNTVPLTPQLIGFIEQAQALRRPPRAGRLANDAPVFASPGDPARPIRRLSISQGMARLCADIGLPRASPHDLRRTARTLLARESLNVSHEDAERVMSHVVGSSIARTYNLHTYAREKRRALEALASELDRIRG